MRKYVAASATKALSQADSLTIHHKIQILVFNFLNFVQEFERILTSSFYKNMFLRDIFLSSKLALTLQQIGK